jgi:diguanylate cyclase (GGDEF)-like protein/PAS domain S-box-containing protein
MQRIVSLFSRLGFWPFVFLNTVTLVIITELLISIQVYGMLGEWFSPAHLTIGFATSLLVGFAFFLLTAYHLRYLLDVQKKLRRSNARLTEAQQTAHLGFWEFDVQADKIFWSDEVYSIFGLQPQEFEATYEAYLEHVHPDDRDTLAAAYRSSLEERRPYSIVHRVIQKDGALRYAEGHCQHTYDAEGRPLRSTGTVYDITERIKDQEKLQRLFDLQENIVIQSDGQRIKKANRSFLYFFDCPSLEAYRQQHECVCEHFAEESRYFHLGRVPEGANWIETLQLLPKKERIVSMANALGIPHAFSVTVSHFENGDYILAFNDISETIREQISLKQKINHDHLTSAFSREFVEENVHRFIERAEKNGRRLGLILFDVDHFKKVNDTYGHHVGDKVLVRLVTTVKASIRRDDVLVRWGGEEFIIIAEADSLLTLQQMAEHVRQRVELQPFGAVKHLTCSFGLALHRVGDSIYQTVQQADTALYEAKESGRNRVCQTRE